MDSKMKLAEKMLMFFYAISETSLTINANTFTRYMYIYFLTSAFLSDDSEEAEILIDKGSIKIVSMDAVLNQFKAIDFIKIDDNTITVLGPLREHVDKFLSNENGAFAGQYREIEPFVNILNSYSDQLIFSIFFNEPTFIDATRRSLESINSRDSKLSKLLIEFKEKIDQSISEYDVLSYWMDYILKNYYRESGDEDVGE